MGGVWRKEGEGGGVDYFRWLWERNQGRRSWWGRWGWIGGEALAGVQGSRLGG